MKNFTAWLKIPGLRGSFSVTKGTNDLQEAKTWLAQQVARHPESEEYGIDNNNDATREHLAATNPKDL